MILRINSDFSPTQHKMIDLCNGEVLWRWLSSRQLSSYSPPWEPQILLEKCCVFLEVNTEFLKIIWTTFCFGGLIYNNCSRHPTDVIFPETLKCTSRLDFHVLQSSGPDCIQVRDGSREPHSAQLDTQWASAPCKTYLNTGRGTKRNQACCRDFETDVMFPETLVYTSRLNSDVLLSSGSVYTRLYKSARWFARTSQRAAQHTVGVLSVRNNTSKEIAGPNVFFSKFKEFRVKSYVDTNQLRLSICLHFMLLARKLI
jgi:hypothetical protein